MPSSVEPRTPLSDQIRLKSTACAFSCLLDSRRREVVRPLTYRRYAAIWDQASPACGYSRPGAHCFVPCICACTRPCYCRAWSLARSPPHPQPGCPWTRKLDRSDGRWSQPCAWQLHSQSHLLPVAGIELTQGSSPKRLLTVHCLQSPKTWSSKWNIPSTSAWRRFAYLRHCQWQTTAQESVRPGGLLELLQGERPEGTASPA